MMKYEKARQLKSSIGKIRENYTADLKSKEMRIRQRAVALYFIDKLALRAGNEKDEDSADTVGCCSLRVEHITLHQEKDGKLFRKVNQFLFWETYSELLLLITKILCHYPFQEKKMSSNSTS